MKSNQVKDPVTPTEWQDSVDAAEALLAIDSARRYGLINGGPVVMVERCLKILEMGRTRGFTPAPDAVRRFVKEHVSEVAKHAASK